jgi:hypothetical protein
MRQDNVFPGRTTEKGNMLNSWQKRSELVTVRGKMDLIVFRKPFWNAVNRKENGQVRHQPGIPGYLTI